MKGALVVLLLCTAYFASAVPIEEPQLYNLDHSYPRYIKIPDSEGNLHDVDLEAEPNKEIIDEVTRNPANNQYLLFTRQNPLLSQTLVINDADSINDSNFNPNLPTVVIVHGWLGNQDVELNPILRATFLAKSEVNVIIMDWRRLALSEYATAASGAPAVGRGLGQFMNFLHSVTGAPYDTMHMVGFSLGAHIVGNAGREMGSRVARITGLDPAGPLWSYNSNRLSSNDGVYVEAIHTDGGYAVGGLGIGTAIAHADFFPNGGTSQPGCVTNICNHNRAWELFAASVTYNHMIGSECSTTLQISLNTCRGNQLHMGNDILNKRGIGMYRLDTGRRYPY